MLSLSILIITYGRDKELIETLRCISEYSGSQNIELLLLDNNDCNNLQESVLDIFKYKTNISFSYFNDGVNYGVARGRNYLIEKATGDILVTLDDDIEFSSIDLLLKKIVGYFSENTNVGALAFNIKNFYSRESLRHEIPHGNKKLNFNNNLMTYYFIGAGHAIRKDVYKKCGLYPLDLGLYGGEERDLSFRILENDYDILYASDIVIYHKVSPHGRMPREKENFYRYRNQLVVLNRYMPIYYRFTSNIIWSIFYLLKSNFRIKSVFDVLIEVHREKKQTVSSKTLMKIKKVKGRLLY